MVDFRTNPNKAEIQSRGGNGVSSSTTQRKILEDNVRVGRFCEKVARDEYESDGWNITPASYGYDFLAEKETADGTKLTEHVEVKAGDARLSRLQVETMHKCRREGKSYRVYRVNSNYIAEHIDKEPRAAIPCDKQTQDDDRFKKTFSSTFQIVKKISGIMLHRNTMHDGTKIILLGRQLTRKYCIFVIWRSNNNG